MRRALRPGVLLVMGLCEPMPVYLRLGFTYEGNSMYAKMETCQDRKKAVLFAL